VIFALIVPFVVVIALALLVGRGPIVPFSVLFPLALGDGVISSSLENESGTLVLKLIFLVTVALIGLRVGFVARYRAVIGIVLLLVIWELVPFIFTEARADTLGVNVTSSTAGYIVPWTVFFVDWKRLKESDLSVAMSILPVAALCYGLFSSSLGASSMFVTEWTGVTRLQAGLVPAYLASVGLVGVVGGVWIWLSGRGVGLVVAFANFVVIAGTQTRIPIVVAVIVAGVSIVLSLRDRRLRWRLGAVAVFAGGAAVFATEFLGRLLARTNAGGNVSSVNLSGRDVAWPYFLEKGMQYPVFGVGAGTGSRLWVESSDPTIYGSFHAPHNTYIQLFVDFGIIGLSLFVALFIRLYYQVSSGLDAKRRRLVFSIFVGFAIYSLTDNTLTVLQPAAGFAVCVAFLGSRGGVERAVISQDIGGGSVSRLR
jgi:O-antigen ligase